MDPLQPGPAAPGHRLDGDPGGGDGVLRDALHVRNAAHDARRGASVPAWMAIGAQGPETGIVRPPNTSVFVRMCAASRVADAGSTRDTAVCPTCRRLMR